MASAFRREAYLPGLCGPGVGRSLTRRSGRPLAAKATTRCSTRSPAGRPRSSTNRRIRRLRPSTETKPCHIANCCSCVWAVQEVSRAGGGREQFAGPPGLCERSGHSQSRRPSSALRRLPCGCIDHHDLQFARLPHWDGGPTPGRVDVSIVLTLSIPTGAHSV